MILGVVLIFLAFCDCAGGSCSTNHFSRKHFHKDIEDYDSVFDRHGNEHFVDDDDYCDDCDDYHEDWY